MTAGSPAARHLALGLAASTLLHGAVATAWLLVRAPPSAPVRTITVEVVADPTAEATAGVTDTGDRDSRAASPLSAPVLAATRTTPKAMPASESIADLLASRVPRPRRKPDAPAPGRAVSPDTTSLTSEKIRPMPASIARKVRAGDRSDPTPATLLAKPPVGRKGTVRQPAPIPIRSERSSSDQQPLPSASLAAAATEIAAYPAPAAESIDGPKTAPDDPATGQGGDGIAPAFSIGTSGNPPPVYPLAARRQGLEGRVLLRVRVAPNGTPADVTMLETSGHAILDGAASDALARWRFEPARRLGLPISGTVDVPIVFRLRGYTKGLGY